MFRTPYWEHVTQRVQTKIFVFSRHFPCYNRINVTTNIKNSGLLARLLRLCGTALKTNRCKKMRICNTALKLARFIIHMMKRKNVLHSRNILEFLRPPEVTGHFKKIPLLYLRKNVLATPENLRVNEQTKYKSVPIFLLFIAVERKPEIRNYWIFEPAI